MTSCFTRSGEVDSLERRIEGAWLVLTELRYGARRHVFLTTEGRLVVVEHFSSPVGTHVGTYTAAAELSDFRADVYTAYQQLRRKG